VIKVLAYTINPALVGMIERKSGERYVGSQREVFSGIGIVFVGGGYKWIEDPDAKAIEEAFARYDGIQASELPY
jgi:hypothetical protein